MSENTSPVLRRRRLGHELRRLRDRAGKKLDEVAEYLECSEAKISRIENGKVAVLTRDVRDMLDLYEVAGPAREALLNLAQDAKREGWWERFADAVPKPFSVFVGLEAEVAEELNYEPLFIPGLLQTPGYARALLLADVDADPGRVEQQVQVRLERQKRLVDPGKPLKLRAIIDEAVLRRQVGGTQVMDEQLAHLVRMAESPNVRLQVIEYEEGAYPGMGVPFILLSFTDPGDQDMVYLEQHSSALVVESPTDIERYRLAFKRMAKAAASPTDTVELIKDMIGRRY